MTSRFASKSAAAHRTSANRAATSTNVPVRQDSPARSRRIPSPSAGWTGTTVRLLFGVIFGIRRGTQVAAGLPRHLPHPAQVGGRRPAVLAARLVPVWISLQSSAPAAFATLVGLTETGLALVLLLGVARRAGYTAGVMYTLLLWGVGEGFGGPYRSGATDIGPGIIYALLFVAS